MSFSFCVDPTIHGADAFLTVENEKLKWLEECPSNAWLLKDKTFDGNCLRTLLTLENVMPNVSVDDKYVKAMQTVMGQNFSYDSIPWQHILPRREYRRFLTTLVKNISKSLEKVNPSYCENVFKSESSLFSSLDYPCINIPVLKRYLNDPKTVNIHTLKTFTPTIGSFTQKVVYDRFSTKTGRLTTKSGPDILTLKKNYRNVLISRFPKGKLFYVDFSSLEVRVLLTLAGKKIETKDLYSEIGEKLLPGKSRNLVKLIVIATLYGSAVGNLERLSGFSEKRMKQVMQEIRCFFAVDELKLKLEKEAIANSYIRNFYGRSIKIEKDSNLVNLYTQSTGVDVALLGFTKIVKKMKEEKLQSVPILICHDAIILDVHPDEEKKVALAIDCGSSIEKMDNTFFLDCSNLLEQDYLNA